MMQGLFAWDEENVAHIAKHDVSPLEAECVIETATPPWPDKKGDDKLCSWGPTASGRLLQVVFVLKKPEEVEFEALTVNQWADLDDDDEVIYVVHAMELTTKMKQACRRRLR